MDARAGKTQGSFLEKSYKEARLLQWFLHLNNTSLLAASQAEPSHPKTKMQLFPLLSIVVLIWGLEAAALPNPKSEPTPEITPYNACPSQKTLECCTGVIAGTAGAGLATGTGCKFTYHTSRQLPTKLYELVNGEKVSNLHNMTPTNSVVWKDTPACAVFRRFVTLFFKSITKMLPFQFLPLWI